VVWLQTLASGADKGTLSTLWRSITERQISILEDALMVLKRHHESSNMRGLAPIYLLLMHVSMLWQESVSDAVLGISLRPEWEGQPTGRQILNLWQKCLADCSLSPMMGRKYIQYQQCLSGLARVQTSTLSLSSVAPSTTTGLRSLVTFFCTKLQRDAKNMLIARSMSRQPTGLWFSGHASMSIPSRLQVTPSIFPFLTRRVQDDLDCGIADAIFDFCSIELKAGHTERAHAFVQVGHSILLFLSLPGYS
jgi:hypothetical protein